MNLNKALLKTILLFILSLVFFYSPVQAVQPVSDFRLKIIIDQSTSSTLSLNSINAETGPSVGYGINFPNNFYTIKILENNNVELFSGKTLKGFNSTIINPINLYLPYFNEATKVQLFDENGSLKLEINLSDHNLVGLKNRYAACDLCGYCPPDKPPSNWEGCRQCLYPQANKDPNTKETLLITDQTSGAGPTTAPNKTYGGVGCIGSTPASSSQSILNLFFSVVGGIAFLYLLYGAFVMATSQAEPEKLNAGRLIVKRAIIGIVFTLLSAFIFNFIATALFRIPGFG